MGGWQTGVMVQNVWSDYAAEGKVGGSVSHSWLLAKLSHILYFLTELSGYKSNNFNWLGDSVPEFGYFCWLTPEK